MRPGIVEWFIAVFESRLSGTLLFPLEEVARLTTDESYTVQFSDGDDAIGRFSYQDGKQYLVSGENKMAIVMTEVDVAEPAPQLPPEAKTLVADVQAGVMSRSGTIDYGAPLLRLEFERSGRLVDFESDSEMAVTDDGRFPRYIRSRATWSRPEFNDVYPTITLDIERDLTEGVDWRAGAYGSAGARILDGRSQRLEIEAGLGAVVERFERDTIDADLGFRDRMWRTWYFDRQTSTEELEGRLAAEYEREFWTRGRFRQGLALNPSLSDLGDLRGRSETSLEWSFTDALRLRINFALDYESDPEWADLDNWRKTVDAGFSYRF